jgi:phage head-tail adaptor, putative, SPP1 family
MYATNPGKYRHRVTIEQQVETRDDMGGVVVTWQPFAVGVPAEVLTGPGRELIAADQQQADIAARINLRYTPWLTAKMRILWDGRVFNIVGEPDLDPTGRRESRCKCTAGVGDGR